MSDIRDQFLEHKRQELRGSLFKLCHFLGFKDVNLRTHGEIIGKLESPNERKLICVPRGSLKSSIICVAYPIFRLINNFNLRTLIDSELYTNSKTFLREIKSHLESPRLTALFGPFRTRDSVWNESEIIVAQRDIIKKEASISVGGIGTTKVGQHFDLIIGDDYNSPENTNTPENAQKVIDHYRYNISILEPGGTYVVDGTRYGENDLIGYILENEETDFDKAI